MEGSSPKRRDRGGNRRQSSKERNLSPTVAVHRSANPQGGLLGSGPQDDAIFGREAEQGIALIAVLWVLVLLSVVAAAMAFEAHSSAGIARNMAEKAAARAAADAGIQRALLSLLTPAVANGKQFRTDGTAYNWHFGSNFVRISIRDEGSKINLNDASEPQLTALFQLSGVNQSKARSLAAAVADFRDADSFSRANGAEEDAYRSAGLAWGPKNAPFQSVEELRQVLGISPDVYRKVIDNITVYSLVPLTEQSPAALAKFLLRAKTNSQFSADTAFSIRAESRRSSGAVVVREAILQPSTNLGTLILSWSERNSG